MKHFDFILKTIPIESPNTNIKNFFKTFSKRKIGSILIREFKSMKQARQRINMMKIGKDNELIIYCDIELTISSFNGRLKIHFVVGNVADEYTIIYGSMRYLTVYRYPSSEILRFIRRLQYHNPRLEISARSRFIKKNL